MQPRWKELFKSRVNARLPWDGWDFVALAVACLIVVWVFTLKLQAFYQLSYSGDLFVSVQAARSWLEGKRLLEDNCFGNVLTIHTYFLLLPLGIVAKPFGAPGLLFMLAGSAGATYFFASRILRLLGVGGPIALIAAGAMVIAPFTVTFYQDAGHGFHVETIAPALCLILFYFLLQRRWIPSLIAALAVISVKEDAPIAAAIVALVAGIETWVASADQLAGRRLNWPAALTVLLSLLAIPILMGISWSQPQTMYAHHSLNRLGIVPPGTLSGSGALVDFVSSNVTHWLGSDVVRQWLWIMIVGSFGTILLRPYYLLFGLPTTAVAWLVHRNDLLWPPRFFSTETLLWCVTLVGFASVARVSMCRERWTRYLIFGVAVIIAALSAVAQFAVVPKFARDAYLLRSISIYSPQERQDADAVFDRYRRESNPREPVVASAMLFRYAHDRNLFWLNRLHDRPEPIWILGDTENAYDPLRINLKGVNADPPIRLQKYSLLDRRGRFVLLRKNK